MAASSSVPLLFLSLALLGACNSGKATPAAAAPPVVSVITVSPETVSLSSEWIGTLDGYVNAQMRPQVSGYLLRRNYQEGALVRQGQVLFEIDPRPFEAVLSQEKARLAEAQAQLGKTERDLERDRPLAAERAIAQSQLDNDIQANLAAQAAIQSATAAIETAQLNLEFTKVTSLITGIAAIATAQIGDLVGPATLLTTVSQVDPIKAYFPLSEQEYISIAGRINRPGTASDLWKSDAGLTLVLADGSVYPRRGRFLAADREIDPKTGTIRISAAFANPEHLLRPGQYGRVRAETKTVEHAIVVPQRAVTEVQGAHQVRVVGSDNRIATRRVKVGDRVGSGWIIEEGVTPSDRVVVEGAPATDGSVVNPRPWERPAQGP
jgi:RND family efflux transporter MFP subunit